VPTHTHMQWVIEIIFPRIKLSEREASVDIFLFTMSMKWIWTRTRYRMGEVNSEVHIEPTHVAKEFPGRESRIQ
jgi:hypothetical protein